MILELATSKDIFFTVLVAFLILLVFYERRRTEQEAKRADREAAEKQEQTRRADHKAAEALDATRRANRETAKAKLQELSTTSTTDHLTIGEMTIDVPATIGIDDNLRAEVANNIRQFNAQPSMTERSYTIESPHSVHYLWRQILMSLAKKFGKPALNPVRIVYEWKIPNPFSKSAQGIDFAFLPLAMSCLSWLHLRGALEVKKTTFGLTSRALGNVVTQGRPQAINRAAMSVFARWKAANFTNAHAAFCCYADTRQFGVVRVRITENCEVFVEMTTLWDLPGSGRENESDEPLCVLVHLLYSPAEQLAAQNLNSLPAENIFAAVPSIAGWSDENQSHPITWTLSSLLGSGSFGDVFLEESPSTSVIKLIRADRAYPDRSKLPDEYRILMRLGSKTDLPPRFPVLNGVMFGGDGHVMALKFNQRGIPLNVFLSLVSSAREKLEAVVRAVGPQLVEALEAAHSLSVVHNDVRTPNILLIPRQDVLSEIVAFYDNIATPTGVDHTPMRNLDLWDPDFRVVLNDWGHALVARRDQSSEFSRELIKLVDMLNSLDRTPCYGTFSTHKEPNTPQRMQEGNFKIDDDSFRQLNAFATPNILDYGSMRHVLSTASVEEKPPLPTTNQ